MSVRHVLVSRSIHCSLILLQQQAIPSIYQKLSMSCLQVLGEMALHHMPYCDQGEMTQMMYALGHLQLCDHKRVLEAAEARLMQIMPALP